MALARWEEAIADGEGNVLPGATVEVRHETSGQPLAVLYSDRDGASTIANPVTADANGVAGFHVFGGAYQLTITKDSFSRVLRYVAIGTAQEFDFEALLGDPTAPTIVTGAGNVTALTSDRVIVIKKDTPEATQVTLPSAVGATTAITVKDGGGVAKDYPITMVPASVGSPAQTIDGKSSVVINFDYGALTFEPYRDGSGWFRK